LTGIVGLNPNTSSNHEEISLTPFRLPATAPARAVQKWTGSADSRARDFRKRFFPNITLKEWQDWRWQLRNRIHDVETLGRMIHLSEDERHAMSGSAACLPLAITPYYLSLLDPWNPRQALRRTVVPTVHEHFRSNGEADDPLHEDEDSPVPGIVHRYPDRVLFLVTGTCSTYCRYCTRSRMVGHHGNHCLSTEQWEKGIAYVASHPEVRDVLLSGGDPLTLTDDQLEWLLAQLRQIPHVEFIRIGTKTPAVLPQRITPPWFGCSGVTIPSGSASMRPIRMN
jgi:lysine 2,3-aminomutase